MAAFVPDPARIRAFASEAAFEAWLAAHHATETELWLQIYKKGAGQPTVTYAEALDVALCWGWIDGLKKSLDEASFLQRFTPRQPRSLWSARNREHVARLVAAGRMRPTGQAEVDRAVADGRWAAAYSAASTAEVPPDLQAALDAEPLARAAFEALDRANRYAVVWGVITLKTEAGRAKKVATTVSRLAQGWVPHPKVKEG